MPAHWRDVVIDFLIRYGFQLLGALIVLCAGVFLAGWISRLTERWLQRQDMDAPLRLLLVRVIRLVVMLFALVIALSQFGVQIMPLIAGLSVIGVGIGLAMQGVLSNVVAGLSIIFTKPFRVGEYIEVAGVEGQVQLIELFSTTLLHADRSLVIVPNRKIVGEILHNYGATRQLDLSVGLALPGDLDRAAAAVRAVLDASPRVLKDPEAYVGVRAVVTGSPTVAVRPWVSVDDYFAAQAELYRAILQRFAAEGIGAALPRQEVRLMTERDGPARSA